MPDYHPVFYPFYLSKSLRSIKIINFKNRKIYTLVETQDMPPDCYGYKKLSLAKTQDGRLKIVFVSSEGENTVVQEVQFARHFRTALELAGMNKPIEEDNEDD